MAMDRAEKIGLASAAGGHALLFVALSLSLIQPAQTPPSPPPVSVSLIGETSLKSTAPAPSAEPAPSEASELGMPQDSAPPKPAMAEPTERMAPPAPPIAKPLAKPVERKIEPPQAEPVKRSPAKAEPVKAAPKPVAKNATSPPKAPPSKATPMPKTAASSKAASAASATKAAATKPAAKSGTGAAGTTAQPAKGGRLGKDFLKGIADEGQGKVPAAPAAAIGADVQRSLSQQISRELKPHWRVPPGVDSDKLVTILAWDMDGNGKLMGRPRVVGQSGINASNRPQAAIHAENAITAVIRAAPFDLPADYYSVWKSVEKFEFNRKLAQ